MCQVLANGYFAHNLGLQKTLYPLKSTVGFRPLTAAAKKGIIHWVNMTYYISIIFFFFTQSRDARATWRPVYPFFFVSVPLFFCAVMKRLLRASFYLRNFPAHINSFFPLRGDTGKISPNFMKNCIWNSLPPKIYHHFAKSQRESLMCLI